MTLSIQDALLLIEEQGTSDFLAQAMEEMEIEFVEDATDLSFLLGRARALYEENQ